MKIKTIKKDNYNLHMIKTTKFKTVLLKTVFWDRIKEEEITIRNMLIDNLLFSSKKYPTNKDLSIEKEELFNTSLVGFTYRKGSYIISEINMSVIEDKYTEKGLTEKAIKFYFDVLNKPNIKNKEFDKDSFNINYESLKTSIIRENENPLNYSLNKYYELLGNKIYTYPIDGTLKDLDNITRRDLYNYYNKFTESNNVDIFIIGNFNEIKVEALIDSLYIFKNKNTLIDNKYLSYNKDFTETKISSKFNQSRLIMGSSINKLTAFEKKYTAFIFNIIFGNSPNSKLFLNVREKHSYAYHIASSFSKMDGTFIINAGISKKNYEDTKKQIFNELEDMKKGKFTLNDIKSAKEVIIGILNEIEDYPNSTINHYFNTIYLNDESREKQKQEIKSITKEDIIKLANKINIDTILLIEEDDNERN